MEVGDVHTGDVHNTVVNSTVGTLIQAGVLNLRVSVEPAAGPTQDPLDRAAESLRGALFRQWRAEAAAEYRGWRRYLDR